jgi:16S rRNA (cytosine1402-N4)-methyltransferase
MTASKQSPDTQYHVPVMKTESVDALDLKPGGIYLDVTFGGGGHSRAILEALDEKGRLIGFDRDPDAAANVPQDDRFTLVQADFRHLYRYARLHGAMPCDGILADLGISSHQIDTAERGFSTRFDGALDMRMDKSGPLTAADVVNTYEEAELQQLLSQYGEVRNAKTLARALVAARKEQLFQSTEDLKRVASKVAQGNLNRYLAQVFQALRIEVNDEMNGLREFLAGAAQILRPGGVLAVITYHSLEDRPVKQYMLHGDFADEAPKDFYGKPQRPFEPKPRKPRIPGSEEIRRNPRARSAKLRIGIRTELPVKSN